MGDSKFLHMYGLQEFKNGSPDIQILYKYYSLTIILTS